LILILKLPVPDANTNALMFLSDDDCWDAVNSEP